MASIFPTVSDIEQALENLRLSNATLQAGPAVEVLASASRHSASVRSHLADSSILAKLVELVECGLTDSLEVSTVALRCIGNACIDGSDGDRARDSLTQLGFTWALQCLTQGDRDLRFLTIKVLFNICSGHEIAQKRCCAEHVHYEVVRCLMRDHKDVWEDEQLSMEKELAIELLFVISGHRATDGTGDALPNDCLEDILVLAQIPPRSQRDEDLELYASLIETTLIFLRDIAVQGQVVERHQFYQVWRIFTTIDGNIAPLVGDPNISLPQKGADSNRQLLVPLSASLIWVLSDIAANPGFAKEYSLDDPIVEELVLKIVGAGDSNNSASGMQEESLERSVDAACQIIGNLLWVLPATSYSFLITSEDNSSPLRSAMEGGKRLHISALAIVLAARTPELLHSAAGLLIQLARPGVQVRRIIGEAETAEPALSRLCQHERPELRQDAIKLLKALGKDCPPNQQRFIQLARTAMESLSAEVQNTSQAGSSSTPTIATSGTATGMNDFPF